MFFEKFQKQIIKGGSIGFVSPPPRFYGGGGGHGPLAPPPKCATGTGWLENTNNVIRRVAVCCAQGFNAEKGKFEVMMTYFQHPVNPNDTFHVIQDFHWPNPSGMMPPDEPLCGFRNDQCKDDRLTTGVLAAAVVVPILAVTAITGAAVYTFLKLRSEQKII